MRRIFGALLGGAFTGLLFLAALHIGLRQDWWQVTIPSSAKLQVLFYAVASISLASIYPVTWRVARRFGWRGFGVCLVLAAAIGPPRDYFVATLYPQWITFSSGSGPMVAVATIYVGLVALGHAVMRLVAGPATRDRVSSRGRMAA
jgi:hypothetical protein